MSRFLKASIKLSKHITEGQIIELKNILERKEIESFEILNEYLPSIYSIDEDVFKITYYYDPDIEDWDIYNEQIAIHTPMRTIFFTGYTCNIWYSFIFWSEFLESPKTRNLVRKATIDISKILGGEKIVYDFGYFEGVNGVKTVIEDTIKELDQKGIKPTSLDKYYDFSTKENEDRFSRYLSILNTFGEEFTNLMFKDQRETYFIEDFNI